MIKARTSTVITILTLFTWPLESLSVDGVWEALNSAYFIKKVQSIDIGYTTSLQKYTFAGEGLTGGKIWVSINDGLWNEADLDVSQRPIREVAVQKGNFNYAWALVAANDRYDNGAGPWLFDLSTLQWSQKIAGLADRMTLGSMAVHYGAGWNTELVGGGGLEWGEGAYLFRSTDNGDNWIDVTGGIPGIGLSYNYVTDIAISAGDPQICYFLLFTISPYPYYLYRGLYRSTDGGDTWRFRGAVVLEGEDPQRFSPTAIVIDPGNSNRVLVGVAEESYASTRVLESPDGGNTWDLFYTLDGGGCTCNSIRITSFDTYMAFYAGNRPDEQFVRLAFLDESIPLDPEAEQPGDKRAYALAVDPLNDAKIYVGTEHMVYCSDDWGFSVRPCVEGANLY